jgi:DsbC/DsbD-like thiol-disulfide interchange protein
MNTRRFRLLAAAPRRVLCLALALFATVQPASAGGTSASQIVSGQVLGGWETANGTRMAALRLDLAPGWKTYWRAPGDAGIPPSFNWKGSDNLRGVSYHWPRPDVFESFGMRTVGYKDSLILPIELHPRTEGAAIRLKGEMDFGVCETICVPAHLSFDMVLDGSGASDPVIRAALADGPRSATRAGVSDVDCQIAPISDGIRLTASIRMPALSGTEVAIVEAGDPRIWVSEPETRRKGDRLEVVAELVPPGGQPMALDRSAVRFTVIGSGNAVDIRGCSTN